MSHSGLRVVIVKNSAEGKGSVSHSQAKGRGRNAAIGAVVTIVVAIYDALHYLGLSSKTRAGPFSLRCLFLKSGPIPIVATD